MKLVPLLLKTFLLLGLCFSTRLEAQEKSKSEEKKTSAAKTVSKKQLQVWINQLSEGTFRERRTASNKLLKAGKQALPALVKGAQRKDVELGVRCVEIIIKMYRGKNETLYFAVRKALSELEKSSNSSVARRAKNAKQNFLEFAIDAIEKLGGRLTFDKSGNVEDVILRGPNMTDAGLVNLKGLTNLHGLFLQGTKVTDSGVKDLQAALPNCYIDTQLF